MIARPVEETHPAEEIVPYFACKCGLTNYQ